MCVDAEESQCCDMPTAESREERERRRNSFREKPGQTQHCIPIPPPFESIQ